MLKSSGSTLRVSVRTLFQAPQLNGKAERAENQKVAKEEQD